VIPNRYWSTTSALAEPEGEPSLLGLSLRLCNPEGALEQVWHVLEILEGSPAQSAGESEFAACICLCRFVAS
jgi:hypothetical protein